MWHFDKTQIDSNFFVLQLRMLIKIKLNSVSNIFYSYKSLMILHQNSL